MIFIETEEGQIDSGFSIKFGIDDIYDTDIHSPNIYNEELHVVAVIDELHGQIILIRYFIHMKIIFRQLFLLQRLKLYR